MRRQVFLFLLAIVIFIFGLFILGKALYRWVNEPLLTVTDSGEREEVKVGMPGYGRDQSPLSWRRNPFSLTARNERKAQPVVSNLILKGTVIGNNKIAVIAAIEDPGRSYLMKVGDRLMGEEIVSIEKGQVIVRKDGILLTLRQAEE